MSQSQAGLPFDQLVNQIKEALTEVTRRSDIGQLPVEASLVDELEHDDLQTIASVARFVHARVCVA